MNWKERLKGLRGLAKSEERIQKEQLRREEELRRERELLGEKVCSGAQKVCKKFAYNVGWELSTDTGIFSRPSKFYIEPRQGNNVGQKITVGIDCYEGVVTVEPPRCLNRRGRNTIAMPFARFSEDELATELEKLYKSTCSLSEDTLSEPETHYEDIPGALDLGWYYSENKDEFQMAKIREKDRATHLYVVGATGTGKTKFLEFLIQQDIGKGNGFGVIDPHGDLVEDIKGFLACDYESSRDEKKISERLILIDPTDPDFTVTFNPLDKLPGVSAAEQANELIGAFKKIWADSWGVRMEDLMRNSLIALGEAGLTLVELPQFLTRRAFRQSILGEVSHPIAKEYFQRFDLLTDRGQITWIQPVMNKINAFLSDDRIRQMFSHTRSSFNLREIMDRRKVLLIKLDKGKLKGSADLLGSLLMAKIQMAAFSRSNIPQHKRTPFYLYIDEFQNFASESFAVVLSEARKYGLSLIMCHQTLSQIPDELRGLILGNTGIQVYFRLNRQDANLLAKEGFQYSGYEVKRVSSLRPTFWSLGEEWERKIGELQGLSPRVCYVKHKIEGGIIPLRTVDIEPTWEALEMTEEEYLRFLKNLSFGKRYLMSRKRLAALSDRRYTRIEEKIEVKPEKERKLRQVPLKPSLGERRELGRKEVVIPSKEEETPVLEGVGGSQHRYLQTLIKRTAEEKGYRAIVEQATPDGLGKVDVGLERDGKKIACEISLTSTDEQELSNIEKCLKAGYEKVILCSPEKKTLKKVKKLAAQKLKGSDQEKVLFFQPEELFFYLEEQVAGEASKEERVKGYKVKVQYQPVEEAEKRTKREAVAQVIVQALRRLKKGK